MSPFPPKNPNPPSLYPQIYASDPQHPYDSFPSSAPSLYPSDLGAEDLFPYHVPSAPPECTERVLIRIHGSILNLIDNEYSVQLATGDFIVHGLFQGEEVIAVIACVDNEFQWPITKDAAAVKLDDSHYFFSLNGPGKVDSDSDSCGDERGKDKKKKKKNKKDKDKGKASGKGKSKGKVEDSMFLSYGLTIASKVQEGLVKELDIILEKYSAFSVQQVKANGAAKGEVLDGTVTKEMSPEELHNAGSEMRRAIEERSAAYWTTLAPNVEEYSSTAAKLIAKGSGQLIRGILWCGDVTVDRLNWGNDVLMKGITKGDKDAEIDPNTFKRIKRAKKMTRMTEKVATGVLSGVVRVSGFFTSSLANSKAGKKFLGMLPGEIVLASLDGFNKVCDAVEVAGKNVMATSSTVTTGLVTHKYGEQAGEATHEGLHAAGHAFGTAWAVFKLRKALNPKNAVKPSNIAKTAVKAAAAEAKAQSKNSK